MREQRMTSKPSDEPRVCHGSDWPEHEDFLIGNEEGFRNLISACEEAMKSGEAKSDSIGEFVGVRLVDAKWAERQNGSTNSLFGTVVGGVLVVAFFACLLVGLFTIVSWFV